MILRVTDLAGTPGLSGNTLGILWEDKHAIFMCEDRSVKSRT